MLRTYVTKIITSQDLEHFEFSKKVRKKYKKRGGILIRARINKNLIISIKIYHESM